MKIALLTIWHEKNYGAELQAYATIKVLQQLGHDVKMIDIRLSDMGKPSLGGRISLLVESISPNHRKFEYFWKSYIPTTQRYTSIEELQANPPEADIYIWLVVTRFGILILLKNFLNYFFWILEIIV